MSVIHLWFTSVPFYSFILKQQIHQILILRSEPIQNQEYDLTRKLIKVPCDPDTARFKQDMDNAVLNSTTPLLSLNKKNNYKITNC